MKYINSIKVKQGKFGLKISFNLEKLILESKPLLNEKGFINIDINPRKEVSQYGETHSVILNEWQPSNAQSDGIDSNKSPSKQDPSLIGTDEDKLPF